MNEIKSIFVLYVLIPHLPFSCGPSTSGEMVSRRKILSRSRDDLNMDAPPEDEEDVWYAKEKLFKVRIVIRDINKGHVSVSTSSLIEN